MRGSNAEVHVEHTAEAMERLQRCITDLVSVLALPAMWSGAEPSKIAHTLLDALIGMLHLDLVYLRLRHTVGDSPIEMVRVARSRPMPRPHEICEALRHGLGDEPQNWPPRVPNPIGGGHLGIMPLPLGLQGEIGMLVAASERADFPGQTERLVLSVAANQAAIGFQEARLLGEQKRVARELDERVEQRTKELAVANDELRTALNEIKTLKDQLDKENIALREEINQVSMFEEIVGVSPPLRTVLSHVSKVAPMDSTVLITGETGTGKELVARAIHKRSKRSSRAFVSVNCAAIPSSLVASELFGHEKGAFTGAIQRRQGRFELADGGTIFLDEVGELPAETQVMLLRVLQEREFERVGGTAPIRVDVRIIAATNRNLEAAIADGVFRSDLFYRLNVFPLEMPALRERRADIPLLVEYFIHRYARRAAKRIRGISKEMSNLLQSYDWPGNIRELQNVIERAVIVSDSEMLSIDERWLAGRRSPTPPTVATAPISTLATHEKDAIEAALAESKGRVSGPFGAAARLGVPPSTLESKIKALKIDKRRFK